MNETIDITVGSEPAESLSDDFYCNWIEKKIPSPVVDRKYRGTVQIVYCSTTSDDKSVTFENCEFEHIIIKNQNISKISKMNFKNCRIGTISFFHCSTTVNFESTSLQLATFESCNIPQIRIERSKLDVISFEQNSVAKNISIVNDSRIETLDNKDADFDKVILHASLVDYIHINKTINKLEIAEGAVLESFCIENKDELQRFLETLKNIIKTTKNGTHSQIEMELRHQQQIILAAYNCYTNKNKFQEMDICLLRLRKINCLINRLCTKNHLKKIIYLVDDFVLGKMFGWGIKIFNSLITSLSIIGTFAVIYFFFLKDRYANIYECIYISCAESVNRFFNANEVDPISILPNFDTIEQIIGVIILTILTGVIARKIIR